MDGYGKNCVSCDANAREYEEWGECKKAPDYNIPNAAGNGYIPK
jgi:hypothetical protein